MTRKPVFQQHSDDETVSIRKKTALWDVIIFLANVSLTFINMQT
jgi:hypothetical protein